MPSWVSDVADIAQIAGIALAATALWIAADQLRKAIATGEQAEIVAEAQAVLALDQVLAQQSFENLRGRLASGRLENPSEEDQVLVRRYVAAFERLGLLLDKRVINLELADALYGSRVERLVRNCPFVCEVVAYEGDETKGRPAWKNFISLWRTMESRWTSNPDRPAAPHLSASDETRAKQATPAS